MGDEVFSTRRLTSKVEGGNQSQSSSNSQLLTPNSQEIRTMDTQAISLFLLVLTVWIVLNRWVLPRFGISTCMACSCAADRERSAPEVEQAESTGEKP